MKKLNPSIFHNDNCEVEIEDGELRVQLRNNDKVNFRAKVNMNDKKKIRELLLILKSKGLAIDLHDGFDEIFKDDSNWFG